MRSEPIYDWLIVSQNSGCWDPVDSASPYKIYYKNLFSEQKPYINYISRETDYLLLDNLQALI